MKPIFQKYLQYGEIWPRNRQKNAQIEDFGHFLDFTSLVFLDFVHNDRWVWCLVFVVFKIFTNFQYSIKLKTLTWISVQHKFLILIYFQSWQRADSLFFGQKNHCNTHYSNTESNTVYAKFISIFLFLQKSKKYFVFLLGKRLDNSHDAKEESE